MNNNKRLHKYWYAIKFCVQQGKSWMVLSPYAKRLLMWFFLMEFLKDYFKEILVC